VSAIVADASVIVRWFVEEEHSEPALRLRDDQVEQRVRIVIPSLAGYEVLNALRYSGSFGAEELVEASRALDGYQFMEVGMGGRYAEVAVRISLDYGVTVYDAAYLSIAKLKGLEVYTARGKFDSVYTVQCASKSRRDRLPRACFPKCPCPR
jgi:predicted nucleic acid-binding protein